MARKIRVKSRVKKRNNCLPTDSNDYQAHCWNHCSNQNPLIDSGFPVKNEADQHAYKERKESESAKKETDD